MADGGQHSCAAEEADNNGWGADDQWGDGEERVDNPTQGPDLADVTAAVEAAAAGVIGAPVGADQPFMEVRGHCRVFTESICYSQS